MIVLKFYFHAMALLKLAFFKLIYGRKLSVGPKTTWRKGFHVMIEDEGYIKIGKNCFFNHECSINSKTGIEIGEACLFGENVKLYDHNHRFSDKNRPIKEQGYRAEKIEIGKHCWIGSNVVILKGTVIDNNCVIGAGCVLQGEHIKEGTIIRTGGRLLEEKIRWK